MGYPVYRDGKRRRLLSLFTQLRLGGPNLTLITYSSAANCANGIQLATYSFGYGNSFQLAPFAMGWPIQTQDGVTFTSMGVSSTVTCPACYASPCALPTSNLNISFVRSSVNYSGTLTYQGALNPCVWIACIPAGGVWVKYTLQTGASCTSLWETVYTASNCTGVAVAAQGYWCDPAGCNIPGSGGTALSLSSYSCSPLNYVITGTSNNITSRTITL